MDMVCLLDSGAYTVWKKGTTIDLDKYASFVLENRGLFKTGAFNLDVIGSDKLSYVNWLELRKRGVDTIPIQHTGDEDSWLVKYLDDGAEYIGLSITGGSSRSITWFEHIWKNYLLTPDGRPRVRVHGMGLSDQSTMLRYPWYSVDSTRSVMQAAMGIIMVPKFQPDGTPDYSLLIPISVSDQSKGHQIGSSDSLYGMPSRVRNCILEYCKSLGFDIDESIDGRVKRPVYKSRKKGNAQWENGLGIEFPEAAPLEDDGTKNNLTRNWEARLKLNVLLNYKWIAEWRSRGKVIRFYDALSAEGIFRYVINSGIADFGSVVRVLLSYHYIATSKTLLPFLKETLRGSRTKQTGGVDQQGDASDRAQGAV